MNDSLSKNGADITADSLLNNIQSIVKSNKRLKEVNRMLSSENEALRSQLESVREALSAIGREIRRIDFRSGLRKTKSDKDPVRRMKDRYSVYKSTRKSGETVLDWEEWTFQQEKEGKIADGTTRDELLEIGYGAKK